MTSRQQAAAPGPAAPELHIDLNLLRDILRRRWRVWVVLWPTVFLGTLLVGLFFYPQSFRSTVSISLQQPLPTAGGALAGLLGGANQIRNYLGVIKSRSSAEAVERDSQLRALYRLPSQEKVIEKIQKSLYVEDAVRDGLLYIHITLDGPARFSADEQRRQMVKEEAARLANNYAKALKHYLVTSDTEKDSVLLRSGENQVRQARRLYDESFMKLVDYLKRQQPGSGAALPGMAAAGMGSALSGGGSGGGGLSSGALPRTGGVEMAVSPTLLAQLQDLYVRRGRLEAQLKALDAAQAATDGLLADGAGSLNDLPAEDPLLGMARANVAEEEAKLKNLRIQLGEENPRVVEARERLRIAQEQLNRQKAAILQGRTSARIQRQQLQSEYATVQRQVSAVEAELELGRRAGADFERLRNELTLNLQRLSVLETKFAELKLQTVAAQNRMTIVDAARPALRGSPSITVMTIICALGALLVPGFWLVGEYLAALFRREVEAA